MSTPRIRGVVKNPGEPARELEVDRDLQALQAVVGGYLEGIEIGGYAGFCNEEGKLTGLPRNIRYEEYRDIIVGPVFMFGPPDDEGDETSLTDEQVPAVIALLNGLSVS